MGGYTKNIAVIRQLKSGFSVDGGPLSGLVKAEKYGSNLKVEVSLINFAPVTEGKYVAAISDGRTVCVLDGLSFEGESRVDTGDGFATLICFVNGEVSPVASAVCGPFQSAVMGIREEIERQENLRRPDAYVKYEDEALAQENYYEYEQAYKNGQPVCEDKEAQKDGLYLHEDEAAVGSFKKDGVENEKKNDAVGGLFQGGSFFDKMKKEIETVLSSYPKEEGLERTVENSRFVRIHYGEGKFYVFGVIYGGGKAQYICYGVPAKDSLNQPASLTNSSFIPSSENGKEGYWVMYQDAKTGATVKLYNN